MVNRVLFSFLLLLFPALASAQVSLLLLDWTSQRVLTYALGQLMSTQGIEVRYVSAPTNAQWFYLANGKADVQVEVWEGTMSTQYIDLLKREKIWPGGDHDALTREEWWYPDYVEELCPGLPDWRALDRCAELFSGPGSDKGIYVAGHWEKQDRARIRALGMNFEVRQIKNSDELWEVVLEKLDNREPVVFFNWTPNWVEAKFQGKFVEFPDYDPRCETDAKWGLNPVFTWDCGNPKHGWLKKAVATTLPVNSPCAYQIVRAFRLDNDDLAAAAALVDVTGLQEEYAATRWLRTNSARFGEWLSHPACQNSR